MIYWETFLRSVRDCRALEIITGARKTIAYLISKEGKQKLKSFPVSLSPRQKVAMIDFRQFFEVGVSKIINDILEVVPQEGNKIALEEALKLVDPTSGNLVNFVDGRMEAMDLPQENRMLIAIGATAAWRMGKLDRKFQMSRELQNRCTKLVEIHRLAHGGIASLPLGLPINMDDAAPLPIPFLDVNRRGARLDPVSVKLILD